LDGVRLGLGELVNPLERQLARLRSFNSWIKENDPRLRDEAETRAEEEVQADTLELAAGAEALQRAVQEESIILRTTRPVLAIRDNITQLEFHHPGDGETWKERLQSARETLDPAIRAVGRINLLGGALAWIGTGWLVAANVLVTNRHVARAFAQRNGEGFEFRIGADGRICADVDFLQELNNPATLSFTLMRPLYIEDARGPDIAFFEVEVSGGDRTLAQPLRLAENIVETKSAAVIGYPAYDSRIPEPELMEQIFDKIYNKKRLAPGAVTAVEGERILHNCSTLGGNSGSAVIDLDSGAALGLHYSGIFLTTNYAVRADLVAQRLEALRGGRLPRRERAASPAPQPSAPPPLPAPAQHVVAALPSGASSATITLPLTITVSVGAPSAPRPPLPGLAPPPMGFPCNGEVAGEEAAPADYRDRVGYDGDFLGTDAQVALPAVTRDVHEVLEFAIEGEQATELKYTHYSVVMSRSRRMCFFSACNIDGKQSRKSGRVAWKWDPRIPRSQQIMNECYGNPPKFSRGHMTRREDPGWGSEEIARRGNEDSMHVTNTTPQMQAFNAPIWLALEDYALQNARQDAMKISVFTGPYFSARDPEIYGVRIPLAFWKVITFIHDDSRKLCATGYEMSQEKSLPSTEEFVFGTFASPQLQVATQVPIRLIEARAGLSFGGLASRDPLGGSEEMVGTALGVPLLALEQIRFV
jgi:endonuclease G